MADECHKVANHTWKVTVPPTSSKTQLVVPPLVAGTRSPSTLTKMSPGSEGTVFMRNSQGFSMMSVSPI